MRKKIIKQFSIQDSPEIFVFFYNFLRQETDAATEEQSTFLAYDKRVKELAQELTESQVCDKISKYIRLS